MNDDQFLLSRFDGIARLFPLPNLVLFPQVVQPLHVFEPRYRQLTRDALASDGFIALCLLKPGWEENCHNKPAVHSVACLGRIVADKRLNDGRYVLLLRGISRIRIVEELESDQPYRVAKVELISDELTISPLECRHVRERFAELLMPRFTGNEKERKILEEMINGETALGALCDMLTFRLPMLLEQKQQLLEEADVGVRAQTLLDVLEALPMPGERKNPFPPEFSVN